MPKENNITFPQNELATELAMLQKELGSHFDSSNGTKLAESLWVFRQIEGLSTEQWDSLSSKHDLAQWITLPLDGDAFPHLNRLQKTLERLAYQTEHDPLTGLANRRAFDRILDIEMERSKRAKTPLSLAIFDLDNFKKVNDTYGHPKGDEVLVEFAKKLQETTRRYDLAARFGGEEFALIMAGSGLVKAQRLLTRLLKEFKEIEFENPEDNGTFNVTCSVGLTCYKGSVNIEISELIELADGALYEAKLAGKDQVKVSRLPFVDNVPDDTLVHANEKQFLFGGK